MTKSTITREQLIKKAQEQIEFCRHTKITGEGRAHVNQCAALFEIALAAMDSEPVELPLDYLQGHKDGLEWAAQLAEANHPETGDWLYDDPIELAKAIRKGPDMPPAQPVAYSEPVAWTDEEELRDVNVAGIGYLFGIDREANKFSDPRRQIMLYRHAQPAPVVPEEATPDSIEILASARRRDHAVFQWDEDQRNAAADSWNAFRAAMRQELKKSAGTEAICRSDENVQVLHTKSPAQSDCCPAQNQGWIPVSERMPEDEQEVLTINKMGHRFVSFFDKHSGLFFDRLDAPAACCIEHVLVTHWMPLPAAPQEVR
ncbi:DUF551 domain-containing protein [Klebsiella pneumoniae]|uniref:DUF551 domain-containing protein n=1 Tax=Klebsiella pneumoniae TaxID=573 RepID=UPI00286D89F5|nr:DUF551 domain-containing protein [Klebsiella pneumoniae]